MLNITITEQTPHNMLRAIRAACNELLGETTPERQIQNEVVINLKNDEKAALQVTEVNRLNVAANSELDQGAASLSAHNAQAAAPETDSTGAEWNPELHASTKAKNQDGTWKKRRGAAAPDAPPAPPMPPIPPVDTDSEKKIWALISGGVVTINQVQEVATKHGCADLGALRGASADVKAAVLAELEQIA